MKLATLVLLLLVCSTCCESATKKPTKKGTTTPRAPLSMDEVHWQGKILCHNKPFGADVEIWESDSWFDKDDLLASSTFPDGKYSLVGREDENGTIEPYLYMKVDCDKAPLELKKASSSCIFQTDFINVGGAEAKTATKVTQNFELCEHPFGSLSQKIEVL